MDNKLKLPNITSNVMDVERNSAEAKAKNQKTDEKDKDAYKKNYLNVQLAEGEHERTLTIRLLPMDVDPESPNYGTPFVHVFTHNVKVPKEISKTGWKNYICLSKTHGINTEEFGHKCPFCELNKAAYNSGKDEKDPIKQKELYKISTANLPKETIIVRCIDRNHEDEGVKFWKFNLRDDKTDPYNQIMNLYNLRYEEGRRAGQELNILDIYNGVDLTVKITNGNSAPTITDGRISCPLAKTEEQLKEWLYDKKKWQDVFTAKPYEYLKLVSAMKLPWKDNETGKWVDKEEYMSKKQEMNRDAEKEISQEDLNLSERQDLIGALTINDDDIPM